MSSHQPLPLTHALAQRQSPPSKAVIGVLPGEGIGPEMTECALQVLQSLCRQSDREFEVSYGGTMGRQAEIETGTCLPVEVIEFCQDIFARQGAVFCGPGGSRFVYELRRVFDLYCKFTPLIPFESLQDAGPLRPERVKAVDIIAVRENVSGLYFGNWGRETLANGQEAAFHHISYQLAEVDRILQVAHRLAHQRRQKLCVAIKPHGIPSISQLWQERAEQLNQSKPLELRFLEVDNAAYQLIANARDFDVIVSPNMFGDVLADCGALLQGSRGMSFSGNFGPAGQAVYQTGHGAAYDLVNTHQANPLGQIMSLAMMLRESFDWSTEATQIEQAVSQTLAQGYRTRDIASAASHLVSTQELTEIVCQNLFA